jgi:c-di-GMP-binding flagellar brake protein YcgR
VGDIAPMLERRTAPRYRLPLPLAIKLTPASKQSDILQGRANDISTGGVCFTSPEQFTVGDKIEFSMTLSTEGMPIAEVFVEVQAMVVRVEQKPANADQHPGVAAVIEAYKIIRTKPGPS